MTKNGSAHFPGLLRSNSATLSHYRILHKPIRFVMLKGLIHPIKFEKSPREQALTEYCQEILEILRVFVRHPKMTAMNVIPDLYDVCDAFLAVYGLLRRGVLA